MLLKFELFCNRKGAKEEEICMRKKKKKKKVVGDRQNVTEKRKVKREAKLILIKSRDLKI